MEKHYGEIVEMYLRSNGHNMTQVAGMLNVNRRTLYNWFQKKHLSVDIIYSIGMALSHDFSIEFPELFEPGEFKAQRMKDNNNSNNNNTQDDSYIWKGKYIDLLERYNEFILQVQNRRAV